MQSCRQALRQAHKPSPKHNQTDRVMNWKQALKDHYTGSLEKGFQQFRLGLSLFFLGMVILYCASQLLEPSLTQELAVLAGLIVGGAGFILAMMAHLRMLIGRFIRFFDRS